MENWKPIANEFLGDLYLVSDKGNVKSLNRIDGNGRSLQGRILKPATVRGYAMVLMQKKPHKWFAKVHHVVALSFLGHPPGVIGRDGWQVNHKNGNKLDNRLINLEWVTREQNERHAVINALKSCGERHYKRALSDNVVAEMRADYANGCRIIDIANRHKSTHATTSSVVHNRTWKHLLQTGH